MVVKWVVLGDGWWWKDGDDGGGVWAGRFAVGAPKGRVRGGAGPQRFHKF